VRQDGLVHVSQMADRFVRDPNDVVKVGQKVKVRVVSVDLERGRIALTMRSAVPAGNEARGTGNNDAARRSGKRQREKPNPATAKPAVSKPAVPKPGTIAPNGMRFR